MGTNDANNQQRFSMAPEHHSSPVISEQGSRDPIRSKSAPRIVTSTTREVNTRFEIRQKEEFQNRKEKSTRVLVAIILVFVTCHIFRLSIQAYKILSPTHGLEDHYLECHEMKRLHVPGFVLIAGSVNHLLLVTNSSLNFLIYCCMASRFRSALHDL